MILCSRGASIRGKKRRTTSAPEIAPGPALKSKLYSEHTALHIAQQVRLSVFPCVCEPRGRLPAPSSSPQLCPCSDLCWTCRPPSRLTLAGPRGQCGRAAASGGRTLMQVSLGGTWRL